MLAGQSASGDINVSRFVIKAGAYLVSQVNVATQVLANGTVPIGISAAGSFDTPIPNASELAAKDGCPLEVFGEEENCLLEAGDAVPDGAFLKPDPTGRGIVAAAGEDYYAIAERGAGAAGEKMSVMVRFGTAK